MNEVSFKTYIAWQQPKEHWNRLYPTIVCVLRATSLDDAKEQFKRSQGDARFYKAPVAERVRHGEVHYF